MKTTRELPNTLLDKARKLSAHERVTLRTLIERRLRYVLAERSDAAPFKLRRASFKGEGLRAEFRDASWDKPRDAVYEDRGA